MLASVIIPTHDRAGDLEIALDSAVTQVIEGGSFEVVVVDNAPSDRTVTQVQRWQAVASCPVRYVPEPRVGLHHARHAGARQAAGEILVYGDDDIQADPGWLANLCRGFVGPDVAAVGGPIRAEWAVPPPSWVTRFHAGYLSLLDLGREARDLVWPEAVFGANFAVRRSVLFEVGGFNPDGFADPAMRWYRGDGEMGLIRKLYAVGYRVRYEPGASVRHRIAANRLNPAYFTRRAFNNGIGDAYSAYRARFSAAPQPALRGSAARGRWRGRVSGLLRTAAGYFVGGAEGRLEAGVRAAYLMGVLGLACRLALSPRWRAYALRDHYLD